MKLACAVWLAAVALAQTPPEVKPAAVEGKVVSSLTGEPIRKAELTLTTSLMPDDAGVGFDLAALGDDFKLPEQPPKPKEPKKTYAATSDASGKFRFEGVDAGAYYLKVKRAGFVEQTYKPAGALAPDGRLHLTAGQELADIALRLVPQGAVSGKVVDEDGDPIGDAMVIAMKPSYASGHRSLFPGDGSQTNDRGEFRLGKLAPGRYYLVAQAVAPMNFMGGVPPPPKDGSPETGYVSTYFPRYLDVEEAEAIDVAAGADLPGFVIHLQKSRVVRVKGTALGADGKPLKQAQVMLMAGANAGSMRMASTDAAGKFEIANVAPGVYTAMTMQIFGASGGSPSITMQTLVVPGEGLSDVNLGSVPEASLPGRVTVGDGGKVALKGIVINLEGDGAQMMPLSARADDSGAFVLKKVAPASYDLKVIGVPAGAYVKSVLWNGREKLGEACDFSAGVGGDLQVILGTEGAAFDAKVMRDDKPVEDAAVVLLPEDAGHRNSETARSASTDGVGHVAFQDVRPGNYLVFAWEKIDYGDWFDPALLKAAANSAVKVTITARDKQHVDLKAIPAAK